MKKIAFYSIFLLTYMMSVGHTQGQQVISTSLPETVTTPTEISPTPNPVMIIKSPYKIYYEWDSSEINQEGQYTVAMAASEAKKGNYIVIELDGHA